MPSSPLPASTTPASSALLLPHFLRRPPHKQGGAGRGPARPRPALLHRLRPLLHQRAGAGGPPGNQAAQEVRVPHARALLWARTAAAATAACWGLACRCCRRRGARAAASSCVLAVQPHAHSTLVADEQLPCCAAPQAREGAHGRAAAQPGGRRVGGGHGGARQRARRPRRRRRRRHGPVASWRRASCLPPTWLPASAAQRSALPACRRRGPSKQRRPAMPRKRGSRCALQRLSPLHSCTIRSPQPPAAPLLTLYPAALFPRFRCCRALPAPPPPPASRQSDPVEHANIVLL